LEEDPFYANVFRMPNGQLIAIDLQAQSNNGAYAGDKVAVWVLPAAAGGCTQGWDSFAFGAQSYTDACGVRYGVSVSNQNKPSAFVTVTYTPTGASVTMPVAPLYRGRALKGRGVFGGCTGMVNQGGRTGIEVLHFDCGVVQAALDPNVNALGLTPTTVAPAPK